MQETNVRPLSRSDSGAGKVFCASELSKLSGVINAVVNDEQLTLHQLGSHVLRRTFISCERLEPTPSVDLHRYSMSREGIEPSTY
ncbi:MAG TPA: hypothetical protein VER98_01130, partial [Terriglobia bacterium]|nr:hypothetical protein [Terriglobia bacterium]